MAYCVTADIEAVMATDTIIELADDEKLSSTTTDLDQAIQDNPKIGTRLARAIDDAGATIDGHIRVRYSVPLTSATAYVRKLAVDLTRHNLFSRREANLDVPQSVRDRYKAAMEALVAIRQGKLDLGAEPPPAKSQAVKASTEGPDRLFTEETLEDF